MSVLGDTLLNDRLETVAAIEGLRRLAADCRNSASREGAKGVAETLIGMSREYEEEARRLETKLIMSRRIG